MTKNNRPALRVAMVLALSGMVTSYSLKAWSESYVGTAPQGLLQQVESCRFKNRGYLARHKRHQKKQKQIMLTVRNWYFELQKLPSISQFEKITAAGNGSQQVRYYASWLEGHSEFADQYRVLQPMNALETDSTSCMRRIKQLGEVTNRQFYKSRQVARKLFELAETIEKQQYVDEIAEQYRDLKTDYDKYSVIFGKPLE